MPEYYSEIGHNRLLSKPYLITIYDQFCISLDRGYIICSWISIVKITYMAVRINIGHTDTGTLTVDVQIILF
jgi:hypothetical protein